MIGGRHREKVAVYGYGMMLRKEDINSLTARFEEEAASIKNYVLNIQRDDIDLFRFEHQVAVEFDQPPKRSGQLREPDHRARLRQHAVKEKHRCRGGVRGASSTLPSQSPHRLSSSAPW